MHKHFLKCLVTRQVFTTSSCIYGSQYHKLLILQFGNGNCVKNHSFINSYLFVLKCRASKTCMTNAHISAMKLNILYIIVT